MTIIELILATAPIGGGFLAMPLIIRRIDWLPWKDVISFLSLILIGGLTLSYAGMPANLPSWAWGLFMFASLGTFRMVEIARSSDSQVQNVVKKEKPE